MTPTAPSGLAAETGDHPLLSLNDLIGLHYKHVDNVHKPWNYLWLTGAATITAAVNNRGLAGHLLCGFVPFAAANGWLVFQAQREAYTSSHAVKATAAAGAPPLLPEVDAVIRLLAAWSAGRVLASHVSISTFVAIVLTAQFVASL